MLECQGEGSIMGDRSLASDCFIPPFLSISHTHIEHACAVNSSSSSLWLSSGRRWCWRVFGGVRRSSN